MSLFRRTAQVFALTAFGVLATAIYFAPNKSQSEGPPNAAAAVPSPPVDPALVSADMVRLVECSARGTCPRDALDKTPCNPRRHVEAVHAVTRHGFGVSGVQWLYTEMVTFIGPGDPRFNIALNCDEGKRGLTLRPFVAKNATEPQPLDMMADVIATDTRGDVRKIRVALAACFADGTPYAARGVDFWCHSPTSKVGPKGDYRVFVNSTVKDTAK